MNAPIPSPIRSLLEATQRVTVFAIALAAGGCMTRPGPEPRAGIPPAQLRQLAVTTFANTRVVQLQIPETKASVAAEPIVFATVTPRDCRIQELVAGSAGVPQAAPVVAALAIALPVGFMVAAPVAQEARKLYGVIVADSATSVDEAAGVLASLGSTAAIESALEREVLRELAGRGVTATNPVLPVPAPPSGADATNRYGRAGGSVVREPSGWEHERTYARLASRGIRTVLELKVLEPGLHGAERINPAMTFSMHVRARLVDAATAQTLHYDYLEYASARHRFVEWAANDAQLFRQAISDSVTAVAAEIVAQLLAPAGEANDDAKLARVGLYRRARVSGRGAKAYCTYTPPPAERLRTRR